MRLLEEIYCDVVAVLSIQASGKICRTLFSNELRAIKNRLEPLMRKEVREKAARIAEKFGNTD